MPTIPRNLRELKVYKRQKFFLL
uniref:Uncharacterized protein n=1 Tax=Rhizophora mucronata TaxID=61149 RepID=A0A2P2KFI4_RHIMU